MLRVFSQLTSMPEFRSPVVYVLGVLPATLFGQTGMESYAILGKLLQLFRFKSRPLYSGEYEFYHVR
jgi:hypothetical protein